MAKQLDALRATTPVSKGRGGRPRLTITPRDLHQIEQFAAIGLANAEIACLVGVSERTLYSWLHKPMVIAALKKGRANGLAVAGKKLWDRVNAGDLSAIIWFEKTRGRRSDRVQVINEDEAVDITRQLRAMTDDQLRRIADGQSPVDVLGS
ncbi:hypothetical protein [Synechococcus sp. CCY9202]|uniref:hypothetical protein n=1 Tax=Synechococcus sp. CCY9202 TaxID=174698 RepID=UPI002B21ABA6|nr:hypothetical protein [Synechococcus sp. CCY9202]MEA5424279.1 hypothetical protein [Synechococcus sp. CCY9202]